jgi:hypothetical protein
MNPAGSGPLQSMQVARSLLDTPNCENMLMTVTETARELNIATEDLIYRYLRCGVLRGRKVRGRWEVDADSVAERKRRVALKRSSSSNTQAERARRVAEVEGMFL